MYVAVTLRSESGDIYTVLERHNTPDNFVVAVEDSIEDLPYCYLDGYDAIREDHDVYSLNDFTHALCERIDQLKENI